MFKKFLVTKLLVISAALSVATTSSVEAQVSPGTSGKTGGDLIAIKTDPVLKNPLDMVGIKTDPVLSDPKEMISIKPDPVLRGLDTLNVNASSLFELLAALEKSGVVVSYKLVVLQDVTVLDVSLNGVPLSPFVVECPSCFKYEY